MGRVELSFAFADLLVTFLFYNYLSVMVDWPGPAAAPPFSMLLFLNFILKVFCIRFATKYANKRRII